MLTEVHRVHPNEIVVLTPYSAQKVEIKRIAEKQKITEVEVKTITESQGEYLYYQKVSTFCWLLFADTNFSLLEKLLNFEPANINTHMCTYVLNTQTRIPLQSKVHEACTVRLTFHSACFLCVLSYL